MRRLTSTYVLAAVGLLCLTAGCGLTQPASDVKVEKAIVTGDWPQVELLSQTWHLRDPSNDVPVWLTGEALRQTGKLTAAYRSVAAMEHDRHRLERVRLPALRFASHITRKHPDSARAWQAACLVLCLGRYFGRAETYGKQAVELAPKDPESWYVRGEAYGQGGELDKALADLNHALKLDPKSAAYLGGRAMVEMFKRDSDAVIADVDKAETLNPHLPAGDYVLRGEAFHRKREFDQAIADYTKAIALDPRRADARYWRAEADLVEDRYAQAVGDLGRVIDSYPNWAGAYTARARAYRGAGDREAADADLRKFLSLQPKPTTAEQCETRAWALYELGDLDKALAADSEAIKLDPTKPYAFGARANLEWRLGKLDAAADDYTKAIALDPKDDGAYAARGGLYYIRGNMAQAKTDYNQAIEINPRNDDARQGLISVAERTGGAEAALKELESLNGGRPRSAQDWLQAAYIHGDADEYGKVVEDCTQALKLDPGKVDAYEERAYANEWLQNYAAAVEDAGAVIRLQPDSPHGYWDRGEAYSMAGEKAKSEKDYEMVIKLLGTPRSAGDYVARAEAYSGTDQYEKAKSDYLEAVKLDPSRTRAWKELGEAELEVGEYHAAIRDLTRAEQLNKADDEAYCDCGFAYLGLGGYSAAAEQFDAAIKAAPKSWLAYCGRGVARKMAGQLDGAEADYAKARSIDAQADGWIRKYEDWARQMETWRKNNPGAD